MKKERYLSLMAWCRATPRRAFLGELVCRLLPMAAGAVYLVIGAILLLRRAPELVRYLAVPALTLGLVSALRPLLHRPRPYERWQEATPLMRSSHKGKSCPSRHAASALIIALAVLTVQPVCGGILLALALAIGVSRVTAGLHFITDVLLGYLLAGVCSILLWL